MKTKSYIAQWQGWKKPSPGQLPALIMLIVLSATSCTSSKQTMHSARQDSTVISEVRSVTYIPVPRSSVTLRLNRSELDSLPPQAAITGRHGQAEATVRRQGDTLVVFASCDSLSRQCETYEKEILSLHARVQQQQTEDTRPRLSPMPAFRWLTTGIIIGFLIGIITIIVLIKKF